ncbi:MAG: hypothetical protein IT388_09960, partial [Nitrospirales bacterium]|nr:hypothetical protein [Nitrospirales bacterium]
DIVSNKEPLLRRENIKISDIQRLVTQIQALGGEVEFTETDTLYKRAIKKFSALGRNGYLFEWMVAAEVIDIICNDDELRQSVAQVYHSVATRKLGSKEKQDAELDLVIVTRFGTLLVLELKTFEFSGDLAKSKEGSAYKKSGPYGKAIIVGPLLTSMVQTAKNGKTYPHYIVGPIQTQEATAMQNGIEYIYLDELAVTLRKKLALDGTR